MADANEQHVKDVSKMVYAALDPEAVKAAAERAARKEAKRKEKAQKLQEAADKRTAQASLPLKESSDAPSSSSKKARRPSDGPDVQLSKSLSYLLRHGALKEKLPIRPDGYVPLEAVLARPRVQSVRMQPDKSGPSKPAAEDVRAAVRDNGKKRFEMATIEGVEYVRAVQGHSLEEVKNLDMVPITLNELRAPTSSSSDPSSAIEALQINSSSDSSTSIAQVLHGTTRDAWKLIESSGGLSRMKRNHIHLAAGKPGDSEVISGMRNSSPLILHVDIRQALSDGIAFFRASNGAILTPGVAETGVLPLKYITHVEDRKGGTNWTRHEA